MDALPIDDALGDVRAAVERGRTAVVVAPPGSGKSTRVPPALLPSSPGQVLLLQPRRVAAIALAERIASEQGWRLGREVGYRVRFEVVGDAGTRLWVMTEGTLTRRLLSDPYLEGVGTVVLDEVHERSIHTDLALAYLRELAASVRPELRVVAMSATIDAAPLARFLLDGCLVGRAAARCAPSGGERRACGRRTPRSARDAPHARGARGAQGSRLRRRARLPARGGRDPRLRARARGPAPGDRAAARPARGRRAGAGSAIRRAPAGGARHQRRRDLGHHPGGAHGGRRRLGARRGASIPRWASRSWPSSRSAAPTATQRAGRAGRTAPGRCLRL